MKIDKRFQITALAAIILLLLLPPYASQAGSPVSGGKAYTGNKRSAPLKIAISKQYPNYSKWLKSINPDVEFYNLYGMGLNRALYTLDRCDGLLLSGGPDVEPAVYGKAGDSSRCEIDFKRDSLEFLIIKKAREKKMPILGICRGEQILNVALGGTLIVDIPEDYGTTVKHKCEDKDTCFHAVSILKNSLLYRICGVTKGIVNTNHHQAIDKLAPGLRISAKSPDGIPEAIEWDTKDGNPPPGEPYMIAVQWHPERMDDDSPLSKPIGRYFLDKAREYAEKKNIEFNIDVDINN